MSHCLLRVSRRINPRGNGHFLQYRAFPDDSRFHFLSVFVPQTQSFLCSAVCSSPRSRERGAAFSHVPLRNVGQGRWLWIWTPFHRAYRCTRTASARIRRSGFLLPPAPSPGRCVRGSTWTEGCGDTPHPVLKQRPLSPFVWPLRAGLQSLESCSDPWKLGADNVRPERRLKCNANTKSDEWFLAKVFCSYLVAQWDLSSAVFVSCTKPVT